MSGRSQASPEVRLSPPPRERVRPPPAVRLPAREDVRTEVPRDGRTPAAQDRPAIGPRPGDRPARRGPSSRELLRRALSSPGAARQGFLLREVLGPPVSLRTDAYDRPS